MLYAFTSIKKSINILKNYNKTINEKTDLNKAKIRVLNELHLIKKMAKELSLILSNSTDKNKYSELYDGIDALLYMIDNVITVKEIKNIIEKLMEFNCLDILEKNLNRYDLSSPTYEISNYHNYFEEEELTSRECSLILKHINKSRIFNIMSTRAGKGLTFNKFKNLEPGKITTYGLEHRNIYNKLKELSDKTIKGKLSGSRISNEVFDILFLNTEISWESESTNVGGIAEKREKISLRYHTKLLRQKGILIYKIPFSRLTNDIIYNISKMFNDVQVIKRENNSSFQEILIFGIKDQTSQPKEDIYEYLKNLEYNKIGYDLELSYDLPQGGIKIPEIFRGSELDKDDMSDLILNSGLTDNFWNEINIVKNQKEAKPLLPFNMGQIGLVLTSGCLDGLVEEYEGQYHAIKGMVVKVRSNSVNNNADNEETNIETISNKVQINIVTPDGEFIELA